jgi:hypothetical protein
MLTDGNDCSITDGGYGWLTSTYRLGEVDPIFQTKRRVG